MAAPQLRGNLPHSEEAEQSLIGACIISEEALDRTAIIIKPEDFYLEAHQLIYAAMLDLREFNIPVDVITLSDRIKRASDEIFKSIGGFKYLVTIADGEYKVNNLKHYTKIVLEKSRLRKLISLGKQVQTMGFEGAEEIAVKIDRTIQEAEDIRNMATEENFIFADALDGVFAEIERNATSGEIAGIPTGFEELDEKTGGWQGGRVYVVGARPKMGKTSFFCQLGEFVSRSHPVAITTLEMSMKELAKMLLYQNSHVDGALEQQGKATLGDMEKIRSAKDLMKARKLLIDEKPRNITDLISRVKQMNQQAQRAYQEPIRLLVIDYLQMIRGADMRISRNYQIEDIARSLKELSKELNMCILLVVQVGRDCEDRRDKRPLPGDIKDYAVESDCDGLLLMYRDVYYHGANNKNSVIHKIPVRDENGKICRKSNGDPIENTVRGDIVEMNFYLNRHGPTGLMKMEFIAPYRKFYTMKTPPPLDTGEVPEDLKSWYKENNGKNSAS